VLSQAVTVQRREDQDYISLTDITRYKDADRTDYLIMSWMRNRNTIKFVEIWERLNNPSFNPIEFDGIKAEAGLNSFSQTIKTWVDRTGAIGITSRPGRYGGTFAHVDIATCPPLPVCPLPARSPRGYDGPMLTRIKKLMVALLLGWTFLVSTPHTAMARQDEDVVHYDARIQGYDPDVEMKASTTGTAWMLTLLLAVVCFLGLFKDAKRSHLD
jgi:hypothetical protein